MELKGRRALVTGAGGFIGSHLVEALVRHGCRVRAMLHYDSRAHRGNLELVEPALLREVEIVSGDVADPHFVLGAVRDCEVVFHLAAIYAQWGRLDRARELVDKVLSLNPQHRRAGELRRKLGNG